MLVLVLPAPPPNVVVEALEPPVKVEREGITDIEDEEVEEGGCWTKVDVEEDAEGWERPAEEEEEDVIGGW